MSPGNLLEIIPADLLDTLFCVTGPVNHHTGNVDTGILVLCKVHSY